MSDLCKCGHAEDHHFTPRLGGRCFRHECDCVAFEAPAADRDDLAAILAKHLPISLGPSRETGPDWLISGWSDLRAVADVVLESDWLRERDAAKWAEGHDDGGRDAARFLRWAFSEVSAGIRPQDTPNPYRADRVDAEDGGR